MTIASNIKRVLQKVGTRFIVVTSGESNTSGEYLIYDQIGFAARPFFREYVLEATIPSDSSAVAGSVIYFDDGRYFLVAHKTPEQLKNVTYMNETLLFKCNVSAGKLYRSSGEVRDSQYHQDFNWQLVRTNVVGNLTPAQYGNQLIETRIGDVERTTTELLLPVGIDIREDDRFEPTSGEFFKVDLVRDRIYTGLRVIEVSEDTRP
jgi:hypothetical protein